jgi:nitroimidazol reductase NimA-like FMN-containing flavoprotein (pyridoxamine 5'-phosphate oxidase superfamily)
MILEEIALDECLELIGRTGFGRVAIVDADQRPLIIPVNFSSTPDGIVIRTDLGTNLEQATQSHVALQVDDVNPSTHEGWSVLVRGQAYDVTDALDDRSERLRATEIDTWAPGDKVRRILIKTSLLTGRRLRLIAPSSHDAAA